MGRYTHPALSEREEIMLMRHEGGSQADIAGATGKNSFLVGAGRCYRTSTAQRSYEARRLSCVLSESRTVTPGQGKEFADFARVEEATGAVFYFALPHHPRRRGTNENTNGLVREYFPRAPTSTRPAMNGSVRCMMRSTAGRASAMASGRPTRSTIRRRCTCSENSRNSRRNS